MMSGLEKLCIKCWAVRVPHARNMAGFTTCLPCGEKVARQRRHTVVPMAKSNYVVVSDTTLLKQLNKYAKEV